MTDLQTQMMLAENGTTTMDLQVIYKYNIVGRRWNEGQAVVGAHQDRRVEFKAYAAFLVPSIVKDFHYVRPEVDYIEESQISRIEAPLPPVGVQIDAPATMYVESSQFNVPSWHLARVWQHRFVDKNRYVYDANSG
jgi:hypothetical protein